MRFSKGHKYKTYLYLRFKERDVEHDILGLYFDMGSEYYSYGLRIYKQTSAGMSIVREKIMNNMKSFSVLIDSVVDNGFVIYGDDFKKDHFPNSENSNAKQILNKKNFYIGKRVKLNKKVFSSELADEISDGFSCVGGIYNFLKS